MSGHSKWSTIKRKKGALDAKRGKIFTKLIKEISVAVREGGGDVESNPRLRLAIQNAKGANMPKDNIDRAIKKAAGEGGDAYVEPTYEGYGPFGVAVYVECATDNTNRTVSSVRSIFTKNGGSLGTNGSLQFLFDRKGVFTFKTPENTDEDEFTLELIDAGAEEVEFDEDYVTVTCAMDDFGSVQKFLDEREVEVENAELQRIPNTTKRLDDEEVAKVMKMIDALEDDDDVQKVYHNLEVTEEQMANL
ncbi:DNA-binding regulatory protein, YebC/PmpR family [Catalinimonas alkaloidigena]|uniref:Probable transcriptional regulatory protein SAMN05421823_109243 n=1 Tax=Catalinimonas alkaloidigena TaxID=1075417 RepID=A0A1G9PMZ3_9BACT|nr:YebC/PmpR family DNA-binding transcriptional regulator [Catalinimonas alkaloidigena]SDM00084.1 DNA-binding regulatory protein, YebC/PmpR family [Catalinimonas alkaloidigena]